MYASMEDLPCRRNGKVLFIPGCNLPDNITEDELFTEFGDYGIIDVNIDEHGANILFETIRGASEASKYLSPDLQQQMMVGPMMNGGMMGPMGPMGHMGMMGPMGPMGPMGGPMMPMGSMGMMASGAPMQYGFPSRPVKVHRPHLMKQGPNASIKVTATTDGSRNIISSPEKAASPPEAGDVEDPGIETGQCSLCKKCTSYTCGRCGAFYCSRECQKQSWPSHQTDCNLHMPPLNFAGRRSMTEVEINGCAWQQQRAREHQGRVSPTGKQWRNRNETEGSQERRPPRVSQPGNDAQTSGKDERTQSSSFSRSNERAGGNERRFDERPSNRVSPGSSRGQEPRDERRGDNQRNFNNRRNDDSNFARGRSNEGSSSYSKPSTNDYIRSPRTAPSNAAESSATNGSPRTPPSNVQNSSIDSPKVAEASSTVATLMRNLKLASPTVKPDPAASEAPKSNGVAAPVTPPVAPEVIFEMPGGISIAGGSEVTITHVEDTCIYLRADSNLQTMALLTSKLRDHCASAQPLQRNPKKNEFLAAKFPVDGDFYRAIVKKKQNDAYTVNYVDYGNSQAGLTFSDMKVLTKDIAEVPCMAVRATLKDVVGGLNKEAMDILNDYFQNETLLTMEGGEDLTAGVTLFEKGGESVNVKVLKAMGKLKSPSPILGMMKAAAAPVAAPVVVAPVPVVAAPAPVPVPVVAAPAPVPVPVVAAPAPVPVPVVAAPAPVPVPVVAAPAPVPVPVVAAPAPVPVPVVAAPAPVPVPVVAAPAPVPVPVVAAPAPVPVPVVAAPTPAPVVAAPAPAPAPAVVVPVPAPAPAQNRTFTLEDVTYVPFPPVGSAVTVLINHFHSEHGFFMACPVDMQALERVALLPDQLVALAARTQPFRPGSNELCIAKWSDGSWYRAVCLEPAGNDSYNVLFLEYGNSDTVTYPDIRPYSEELVEVPALSSPCFLSDPNPLTDAQRAKVDTLFHEGWTEQATVTENVDGSISLDIPSIKTALL